VRTQKKKGILMEITSKILGAVLAALLIITVLVIVLVGNSSLTSQRTSLAQQSEMASYQLENFFTKYLTLAEQAGVNNNIKQSFDESKGEKYLYMVSNYDDVMVTIQEIAAADKGNVQACFLADLDSSSVISSDGTQVGAGFDVTSREWYSCVTEKKAVLTKPYVDTATGNLVVTVAAPVYSKQGEITGVAGVMRVYENTEPDNLIIDVSIAIRNGSPLWDTAIAYQNRFAEIVESMTAFNVVKVNVEIRGIA